MRAHILVAEDDPTTRALLADILTDAGYCVVTASNGGEALDLIQRTSFDIVLSDIRMPLLDGIELLSVTRQRPNPPAVILLTGYGSLETVLAALRAGAANYLLKPCEADELLASVEQIMRERAISRARDKALNTILQSVRELQRLSGPEQAGAQESPAESGPPAREDRLLVAGALQIDLYQHTVRYKGEPVHLTPIEFALLLRLARAAGHVVCYAELVQHTHGYHAREEEAQELLKIHVHRLRRKLSSELIVNVRARGYALGESDS